MELASRAREAWNNAGLLAEGTQFRAEPDPNALTLHLIVDVPNVGRKGFTTARVFRSLPFNASAEQLEMIVGDLYRDMTRALAQANAIGVKF